MCITIEKPKKNYFSFDREQYDAELALMRKRIEKMMNKVEKTNVKVYQNSTYKQFKESLKDINHENLK